MSSKFIVITHKEHAKAEAALAKCVGIFAALAGDKPARKVRKPRKEKAERKPRKPKVEKPIA